MTANNPTPAPQMILISPPGLLRDALETILSADHRFSLKSVCATGGSALATVHSEPIPLVLVDSQISDMHFVDLLQGVSICDPRTKCVVLLHGPHIGMAANALRAGARGIVLTSDSVNLVPTALEQVHTGSMCLSPGLDSRRVFGGSSYPSDDDRLNALSSRETQVYHLFIEGRRAKEIAGQLGISSKTVDTYRAGLMRKLGVDSVAGLVKFDFQRQQDLVRNLGERHLSVAAVSV